MADKTIAYLLLHLLQTLVCTRGEDCRSLSSQNLNCYNDYDHNITCFWNSTCGGTGCTIHADKIEKVPGRNPCSGSCKLEPVDLARTLQKCSVVFQKRWRFQSGQTWSIALNCSNTEVLSINHIPTNHVKLNPPPKPNVNLSTISWLSQAQEHKKIKDYNAELQWKQKDQPWSMQAQTSKPCQLNCSALLTDDIILGEWYEARVRVQAVKFHSHWSDWSPTVSWEARTGRVGMTQMQSADDPWRGLRATLCAVAVAVVMLVFFIVVDKTRWVYIVKRIRGPPLPNPEKSFLRQANFQNLVSPHVGADSYYFLSKQVDVVPVEVTSPPSGLYAALQEKVKRSKECYESANFSNPSYSRACSPPAILLSSSNLDACDTDTPYGPVAFQSESGASQTAESDGDHAGTNVGLQQLISRSRTSGPVPVVLEYEKVPIQEHCSGSQCQDVDSCPGKDNCETGLETAKATGNDGPNKVEMDRIDFQKLFGSTRILNEGSIQVCSGYEQVQKLQAENHELLSLDSGVSSGVEDQVSQEDSLEDTDSESNHLLYSPPPLSCASPLLLAAGEPAAGGFF